MVVAARAFETTAAPSAAAARLCAGRCCRFTMSGDRSASSARTSTAASSVVAYTREGEGGTRSSRLSRGVAAAAGPQHPGAPREDAQPVQLAPAARSSVRRQLCTWLRARQRVCAHTVLTSPVATSMSSSRGRLPAVRASQAAACGSACSAAAPRPARGLLLVPAARQPMHRGTSESVRVGGWQQCPLQQRNAAGPCRQRPALRMTRPRAACALPGASPAGSSWSCPSSAGPARLPSPPACSLLIALAPASSNAAAAQ